MSGGFGGEEPVLRAARETSGGRPPGEEEPGIPARSSHAGLWAGLPWLLMLTLVLANNYLLLYVGWEGVGLASYLLIGF
ncbi:MAG: hypothetical protein QHJ73_02530, partial [Armatimonadota bacterium]|nr:hypothetical protein [Armatimonadota bacterium]